MPCCRKGNCWTNKTRLEQILTCILVIALILITILLILLLLPKHEEHSVSICDSSTCLREAAKIIERIDPTVDPCEDFYGFACGGFLKMSHGDSKLNLPNIVKEKRKRQLLELYSEDIKHEDHKMVRIAKTLFKKCMNESEIEKDRLRTIKDVLRVVGGWPVLDGRLWNEKQFDWMNVTYRLRRLGYPYQIILDIQIQEATTNQGKSILAIDIPYNHFEDADKSTRNDYLEVERMTEAALILGSPLFRDEIEKEIKLTQNFSKMLHESKYNYDHSRYDENDDTEVGFKWIDFINNVVGSHVQVAKDDFIVVNKPGYYKRYFNLLTKTPKRTLANYIMWQMIKKQIPYLTKSLRNLTPDKMMERRDEFCLRTMQESFLTDPIEIIRNRKYLSERVKNGVSELMLDMKIAFIKKLKNAPWINNEKEAIIQKAEDLKIVVGEHHNYFDDKILDDLDVDMVKPTSDSFLALLAQATRNYETCRYKQIKSPVLLSATDIDSYVIPYYNVLTNSIIVSALAVDGFFHIDNQRPNYLNYAKSAGYAFVDFLTAMSRDESTDHNSHGFSNETTQAVREILHCLIKQTRDDTVKDNEVEVQFITLQTFGEHLSYAAYAAWEELNGKEPTLIGLHYSPRQMYWITATNCYIPEKYANSVFKDESTPKFVNQRSRTNNPDFARDFHCSLGTKMNPENKCQLL